MIAEVAILEPEYEFAVVAPIAEAAALLADAEDLVVGVLPALPLGPETANEFAGVHNPFLDEPWDFMDDAP